MKPATGLGLKAEHFDDVMASPVAGLWFEVHAENYMVAGGPRLAMLEAIRQRFPVSLHGVGMSLAGADIPDPAHLAAFKRLVDRFDPCLISEHLAWTRYGRHCIPDLLPFPRNRQTLQNLCRNIGHAQEVLGRQILIENPSHYLPLAGHDWSEPDYLAEIAARTGCGLLLDLNNVHVSSFNLGFDAADYLDAFPVPAVGEIHLAGFMPDEALSLLIDNHGAPVADPVWALLARVVARHGPRPVLIEWDRDVPSYELLLAERNRAESVISAAVWERAHA